MNGGFGCWRNHSWPESEYERRKWVDVRLRAEIDIDLELANVATEIECARRLGATEEATDVAYYAKRLRLSRGDDRS